MLVYQRVQFYRGFWTIHFLIGVNQQVDITQIPISKPKWWYTDPSSCSDGLPRLEQTTEQWWWTNVQPWNHQNMGDGTWCLKQCEIDIPSSNRFTIELPRYPPKRRCSCCFSMLSLSLSSCLWNTNFTKATDHPNLTNTNYPQCITSV